MAQETPTSVDDDKPVTKLPPRYREPPPVTNGYRYVLKLQNGITRGFFHDLLTGREALNRTYNGKALIRICDGAVVSVKQKLDGYLEGLEQLFRDRR